MKDPLKKWSFILMWSHMLIFVILFTGVTKDHSLFRLLFTILPVILMVACMTLLFAIIHDGIRYGLFIVFAIINCLIAWINLYIVIRQGWLI